MCLFPVFLGTIGFPNDRMYVDKNKSYLFKVLTYFSRL